MVEYGDLAELTAVDPGLGPSDFRGRLGRTNRGRAFGGQLLGQVVTAAALTAPQARWPAVVHSFFVRAPDPTRTVEYWVENCHDGGSHAWRHVVGKQRGQVTIESLVALRAQPPTPEQRCLTPSHPDEFPSAEEMLRSGGLDGFYGLLGPAADARFVRGNPMERIERGDTEPVQGVWLRPYREVSGSPSVVAAAIALMSDINFMSVSLTPLGLLGDGNDALVSSFDHSLRFYALPDRLDWIYHDQVSVVAGIPLSESVGQIVDVEGLLLATATQQSIVRNSKPSSSLINPSQGEE